MPRSVRGHPRTRRLTLPRTNLFHSIDFATKVVDKATHPNIPRTPADLLHLPPICLALFGGSPFGTAKPCSSAICPELCIVRQRRQASKKLLGRHYLFSIWAIAATHTCRWYHTATTNPKKTPKNMHYLQNIPKKQCFWKKLSSFFTQPHNYAYNYST